MSVFELLFLLNDWFLDLRWLHGVPWLVHELLLVHLLVLELLDALLALLHVAYFGNTVRVSRVEDAERTLGDAVAVVLGVRGTV